MGIEKYRKSVDKIDDEILELLEERFAVVEKIGKYKQERDLPIVDEKREDEKLEQIRQKSGKDMGGYMANIFRTVIEESKKFQESRCIHYGLLGEKLGHSFSPEIHKALGGYEFALFEKEPGEVEEFIKEGDFKGICVTIPYKKEVMKYCDEITGIAEATGSVNVVLKHDGKITGDNTDYYGFRYMAEKAGFDLKGKKAIILGSGGVSGTVKKALEDMGANQVVIISRRGENNYDNIEINHDAAFIVNCTPVGMYPNNGESLVDLGGFRKLEGVMDLIYNPLRTKLIIDAQKRGIKTANGLAMLVAQAARACTVFTGKEVHHEDIERCINGITESRENIVIIGMPGAGKTSTGKVLAMDLNKEFVDLDGYIKKKTGQTPSEIITESGEDAFRKIETEALKEVMAGSSRVIAAGGGIVERCENLVPLRENSVVVYLKRDINRLPAYNRPVTMREGVEAIYERRHERYESWSDLEIENTGIGKTANRLAKILEER